METAATKIDGPRLDPASGRARSLVIFVHGYGADGRDLLALGEYWQRRLPDTAFAAPNAPQPCDMNPAGYQWFPLDPVTPPSPGQRIEGVETAAPALATFIEGELKQRDLGAENLALVGFSQGTMLALDVGLRRLPPVAGILGFSGLLPGASSLKDDIRSKPPVCLIHGDSDELIPPQATRDAAETLDRLGVPVRHHISAGTGHGIAEDGLMRGGEFLESVLRGDSGIRS